LRLRLNRAKKPPKGRSPADLGPDALRELVAEDLAERAAGGCVASYGELVRRYELRLFNFLLRRLSSRMDAEDLAQETFVRAWDRIGSYDRRWRFSTWLFTIASRLAVSHYRKQRPRVAAEFDIPGPSNDDGRDAEADRRLGRRLWALASALGPEQHEALWLRYAEDLSIPEIAQVMRKSHVGVRVCLFRARQALAEKLEAVNASAGRPEAPEVVVRQHTAAAPVPRLGLVGGVG
jgi:RNA polymerase sigma-70 factor (ECF subfamily)